MTSSLGWIDFSSEHRDRVRTVLDLMAEKGVVDELGIGVIRDAFADLMFPGLATIQTRAKYFLIIPRLLKEYESLPDRQRRNLSLTDVKAAISKLASDRANIGSNEESLTYYNDQLSSLKNNLSAANSRITDVDVAQESTNYAKYNILVQSGTAMLAQANSLPQSVLKLLG